MMVGERPPAAELAGRIISCVIVEDQAMFLEMLSEMVALRGGLRVVDQARTVAAGRVACTTHRPDLLILDLALTDGEGLDVARTFVEANPDGRVIVVSGNASDFVCPAWLTPALQAVISKNETFQALRQELDDLVGGGRLPSPARVRTATAELSPREAEIFALMGDGLTTRQIAERLHLSEHTVHTHRKRLALKLGTQGDELTRLAITQRLFSLGPPAE